MPTTMTTRQAAQQLQLNPITVQRWIRDGRLRATKLPGRAGYRIPVSEVERIERGDSARETAASALRRDAERLGMPELARHIDDR